MLFCESQPTAPHLLHQQEDVISGKSRQVDDNIRVQLGVCENTQHTSVEENAKPFPTAIVTLEQCSNSRVEPTHKQQNAKQLIVIEENAEAMSFEIKGVSRSDLNRLRRALLSDVSTMAVDFLGIETNTSGMFDEVLAYRVSLIPLTSDSVAIYNMANDCRCEGVCPMCSTQLHLDTGVVKKRTVVTSSMLRCQDGSVSVADGNQVIATLYRGAQLKFSAYAKRGTGKMHAKWSAVTVVGHIGEEGLFFESNGVLHPRDILSSAMQAIGKSWSVSLC